jgi:hypothetical protein
MATTPKKPAVKKTDSVGREYVFDAARSKIAADGKNRFPVRSFYVDRRDENGDHCGNERTIAVTLDPLARTSIVGDFVVVGGVVYDGNDRDVGRPVQLVLAEDEAKHLAADLVRAGEYVTGGAKR